MGNKLAVSPIPTLEASMAMFKEGEIARLRENFNVVSQGLETFNLERFDTSYPQQVAYARKYVFPRLFATLDGKRDGVIDFEEYLPAVALFSHGSLEDKIKWLYLMYDGSKNGSSMSKENFRQLIVDASLCAQKDPPAVNDLESWLSDLQALTFAMAETAFVQFSNHPNKIDIADLTAFVKVEGTVLELIELISAVLMPATAAGSNPESPMALRI